MAVRGRGLGFAGADGGGRVSGALILLYELNQYLPLTFNVGNPRRRNRLPVFYQMDGSDRLENSKMGH